MALHIDWTQHDGLSPREQYDAAGKLIDEVKALVAARRAEIAADRLHALGAPGASAELGISGTRVYQLAARHHRATRRAETTEYGIWDDTIPGGLTLRDGLVAALGDSADSFDVDAIAEDYRTAINTTLDDRGITLAGESFYGPYPRPAEARQEIAAAVEAVDLWEIVARYDPDSTTG